MEYSKLPQLLNRCSFDEKMSILQKYSILLMSPTGLIETDKLTGLPLPWELETFLLFSIESKEWKNDNFFGDNEKKFINAINAIKSYTHPFLEQAKGTISFVDRLMIAYKAVQFDIQEYYPYKLYRYNYYFSFSNERVNMPKLFQDKFNCKYSDFIVLSQFLWLIFSDHAHIISQQLYDFLMYKFQTVVSNLCITREQYITELDSITTNISDYLYCFRPSYSYPFILDRNKLYLPLPHLLMRSVTSSLMYRLTDGRNDLTELIGKEVLESYLYDIIKDSLQFDEVFSEQKYFDKKGRKQLTLDVLARKDNTYVFFDSKMHSPKRNLRLFDDSIITAEIEYLAQKCKQIYLHIHDRFPLLYNPFYNVNAIDQDKVFGIVVIRDDPHIRTELVYHKTAELLNIDCESNDFDWLCRHIGIAAIYEIEKYCFTNCDLLSSIQANSQTGRINDFWLTSQFDCNSVSSSKVKAFKYDLSERCLSIVEECKNAGVLK